MKSVILCLLLASTCLANPSDYFLVQVIDDQTNRGVPLVELQTVNNIRHYTDSNGYIAFNEPGLMDRPVWFSIKSHGYEFPKDGFGYAGKALTTTPGKTAVLKIHRVNIAERMYRMTGQGIYADTILAGKKSPIEEPLLNARVLGQDSVITAIYQNKIYWFWGDTNRDDYPLGHFGTSFATSEIGEDPAVGINLHYLMDEKGFSKPVFHFAEPGAVWIGGAVVCKDETGKDRLVVHYSRMKDLGTMLEHGLAVFNDETKSFERLVVLPKEEHRYPDGHSFLHDGYFYFSTPFPLLRVKADWKHLINPKSYEKLGEKPKLKDIATGNLIEMHGGSVFYNDFLHRWVLIAVQMKGDKSLLGEVWFASAPAPNGPWSKAIKIVTHDKYTFYNPVHHPFLDQENGRLIYFEGTYANTFSGNPDQTPRYDYNQLMYRLDLGDPRIKAIEVR